MKSLESVLDGRLGFEMMICAASVCSAGSSVVCGRFWSQGIALATSLHRPLNREFVDFVG